MKINLCFAYVLHSLYFVISVLSSEINTRSRYDIFNNRRFKYVPQPYTVQIKNYSSEYDNSNLADSSYNVTNTFQPNTNEFLKTDANVPLYSKPSLFPNVHDQNFQVYNSSIRTENEIPDLELGGIFTDCVLTLSYSCIQKKMLRYIRRLSELEEYNVVSNKISVVRVVEENNLTSRNLDDVDDDDEDESYLNSLLDDSIISFLRSHVLRVKLPSWSAVAVTGSMASAREDAAVDFSFASAEEGRAGGKKGGGGAMKMGAAMMKMAMVAKGMMVPMMIGMMKMMAFKGMMTGIISMFMSKMMFLGGLMKGGGCSGGGGGGGCGGGGGGWPMGGGGGGD